jgi:hypothetical protein
MPRGVAMISGRQKPVNHDSMTAKADLLASPKDQHFALCSLCLL